MKKRSNGVTELVFILDRSGSMSGLEKETIGGFNSLIEKQKRQEGKCYVSTVLFDHESIVLYDRVDLREIRAMTNEDYVPRGMTALVDAIGDAVKHISNIHKYARPEDVPQHTMFVITTDGCENASKRYSAYMVKEMITEKKNEGWEFLFLGANIDAVETASRYGIDQNRSVNYSPSAKGTAQNFKTISCAVSRMRMSQGIDDDWKKDIEEHYRKNK